MLPACATRASSFTLGWKDQISDFKYSALLNVTTMDNEVLSLGRDGTNRDYIDSGQARTKPGRSLAEFYLRKTDGIFKTQEQIDNYVTSTGTPIMIEGSVLNWEMSSISI